ncbi:TerB family tellurite resistance protein [bacterium]|nr:TerB family tellurite resistance protein [bacterium]MBU1676680.1 TerB family tellurite resistance protein [bacterium]
MGLLGALFGGTVGFMLGGPLGMIIGGAIGSQAGGNVLDPGAGTRGARRGARLGGTGVFQDTQTAFVVTLISLAAKVAKADGRVTQAEVQAFDAFLRDNLRMSATDRRMAARIFNEARDSAIPAAKLARQARGILGPFPDRLRDLVTLLLQIAHADGQLHPAEEKLIREIARDLGLTDRDYQECRALFGPAGPAVGSSYEILGVPPGASEAEIKKAYRKIAREYHPDVLQSKGLPEDFMQFAKEKLQKVNEAYDVIKKDRGF